MTDEPRCKNCSHYIAWPVSRGMYYDHEPNGVRATSSSGLIGATRNWINAVRKKSAKQTGAA